MGNAECPDCGKVNGPDVYYDGEVACFECGYTLGYVEVA